jgi:predicted negative regulator of RcsB-dependent stress response
MQAVLQETLETSVDARQRAIASANLALLKAEQGEHDEALSLLRQSADEATYVWGPKHLETHRRHRFLARVLLDADRLSEAVNQLALARDSAVEISDHRLVSLMAAELAERQGDRQGARRNLLDGDWAALGGGGEDLPEDVAADAREMLDRVTAGDSG